MSLTIAQPDIMRKLAPPDRSRRITTAYVSLNGAPPESDWPDWAHTLKRDYERQLADQKIKYTRLQEKMNSMAESYAQTETARSAADRALELYGESEGVKTLTSRLSYMLPNAEEIGTKGVALVAQVAVAHGLDPLPGSDHIYAWTKGEGTKQKLFVVIGYKGLLHLARQQVAFTYESRVMTADERAEHGVSGDAVGYITHLWEIAKAAQCKAAGLPYFPVVGTAVWSAKVVKFKKDGTTWTEYNQPPEGKTGAWVAKKNSLKDALRQITATGQRIQGALDAAFSRYGMQFEQDGDQWSAALPANQDGDAPMTIDGAIASGLVPPDQDDELDGDLCLSCGNRSATDNPIDSQLCDQCAQQLADAGAAS